MGATTGIAWADATWNCWQGCTKVSAGCAHCYMYREKTQYGQDPSIVVRSKPATFNAPLKWDAGKRVFVCSWSDFFHEAADAWRADAWSIIRQRTDLTFLILTKRIERVSKLLPWGPGVAKPPRHVWLGVSVEDQATADTRIPLLLQTPAEVRFVSVEPMLGPVDLHKFLWIDGPLIPGDRIVSRAWNSSLWVICGGESGPQARPMMVNWALNIRDQCRIAGVPLFVKQISLLEKGRWRVSKDMHEWPEPLRVQEFLHSHTKDGPCHASVV